MVTMSQAIPDQVDAATTPTPNTTTQKVPAQPKTPKGKNRWKAPCALVLEDNMGNSSIFGGQFLGTQAGMTMELFVNRSSDVGFGFRLLSQYGRDTREIGFGLPFGTDIGTNECVPSTHRVVTVWFPTNIEIKRMPLPPTLSTALGLTNLDIPLSLYIFTLPEGTNIAVHGFGMPFSNSDEPSLDNLMTHRGQLENILVSCGRQFSFLVQAQESSHHETRYDMWNPDRLSFMPPLPYSLTTWDMDIYRKSIPGNMGPPIPAVTTFSSDMDHVIRLSESVAQDAYWIEADIEMLLTCDPSLAAYFVTKNPDLGICHPAQTSWLVIPIPTALFTAVQTSWPNLIKEGEVKVVFLLEAKHTGKDGKAKDEFLTTCLILNQPSAHAVFQLHGLGSGSQTGTHDFVVRLPKVQLPDELGQAIFTTRAEAESSKTLWHKIRLEFSSGAKEAERKIDAIHRFLPDPLQAAPGRWDHTLPSKQLHDAMQLHRDLVKGGGFWESLGLGSLEEGRSGLTLNNDPQPILPVLNLAATDKFSRYAMALFEQVHEPDRDAFQLYLQRRPLGLGLITAPPGSGKSTLAAVAALSMAKTFKRVLCSAPSHVALNNFCLRVCTVDAQAVQNANNKHGKGTAQRLLAVRGYQLKDDAEAFGKLWVCTTPDPDFALVRKDQRIRWRLGYTICFWVLLAMGSPAVGRELDDHDPPAVHELRLMVKTGNAPSTHGHHAKKVHQWYTGKISVHELNTTTWSAARFFEDVFQWLFVEDKVDMLFVTPAASNRKDFDTFEPRCIAVDEAGAISRPDLYHVWGNTALPCMLFGDHKQLTPVILFGQPESKGSDNRLNRFAPDGSLSPLEFFLRGGWPAFVPGTQFRMAVGMFDDMAEMAYPGTYGMDEHGKSLPPRYGPASDINLSGNKAGRDLEAYICQRYPDVKPAKEGRLAPVFVDVIGSQTYTDPTTHSKKNPVQCQVGLDLICDLVEGDAGRDPIAASKFVLMSPYKENLAEIKRLIRKVERYARVLEDLPEPVTVDAIQGGEGDIAVLIMGTTRSSSPGFTSVESRLTVACTRHKCGFVVVGEWAAPNLMKNAEESKLTSKPELFHEDGKPVFYRSMFLKRVYLRFKTNKRLAIHRVPKPDKCAAMVKELKRRVVSDDDPRESRGVSVHGPVPGMGPCTHHKRE